MDYRRVKLVLATKAHCSSDWCWRNNGGGNVLNLWYVASGVGDFEQVGRYFELSEGSCFLIRSWVPHVATHKASSPLVVPYILFQVVDDDGNAYIPPEDELLGEHRVLPERTVLVGLMDRSIEAWNRGDAEAAQHWLVSALMEVERQDRLISGGSESHQRRIIDNAVRLIEEHPETHWNVAKMASMAGYSTDHFIRLFREFRGTTPGNFQVRCRIAAAVDRLRFSDKPIGTIAEDLGYPDIYCFSRQFSKLMGRPPSSFRR